jgi:hypothetical protein
MASAARPWACSRSTSFTTCVDFPQRSTPSRTMKAPRACLSPSPDAELLLLGLVALLALLLVAVMSRSGERGRRRWWWC